MPSVYKILHWDDELVCNHGGKVVLNPNVVERNSEIYEDKRIVTDDDLYNHITITGCSLRCTKITSIPVGKAKQLELTGGAIPVLGNIAAITDKGCRVTWKGSLATALAEDEGRFNTAYQHRDRTGKLDKLTVGIGHNVSAHPVPGVTKVGDTITDAQVDQLFNEDVTRAENNVKSLVDQPDPSVQNPLHYDDLTQDQQDALTNLTFNMGSLNGWPKFLHALRSGDFNEAARQLQVKADGKTPSDWIQQIQRSRSDRILRQIRGNDKGKEAYAAPE
jgi:GH24 family phage-related lysozyme (muramidase)